jgi:hypothetical protein
MEARERADSSGVGNIQELAPKTLGRKPASRFGSQNPTYAGGRSERTSEKRRKSRIRRRRRVNDKRKLLRQQTNLSKLLIMEDRAYREFAVSDNLALPLLGQQIGSAWGLAL